MTQDDDWESRYREEYAIVDRVWRALGVTVNDNGPAIDDRVRMLRARIDVLEQQLRETCPNVLTGVDNDVSTKCYGMSATCPACGAALLFGKW